MALYQPAPPPKTALGRYRKFSPTAGVHVSPIVLGAMSIGDQWEKLGLGSMDKESSFKLLDAYFDAGGNFIDTANIYQDGSSEIFIGDWAEQRGIRDQLFIATKYSSNFHRANDDITQKVNFVGNNHKSMYLSVRESLKRLKTEYIDLLYVHWWDWETSIEEVMRGLHNLVTQGKVLYLGVSDTPAWVVSRANQYARDHSLTPFVVYQGAWNVLERSFERDIIPMARAEGMALCPFNVLAGGRIRSDEEEEHRRLTGEKGRMFHSSDWERSEQEKAVCKALQKVAHEVGAKNITSVAIAYLMQRTTYVFPIVGGRKVEHLVANIEALTITLSPEQIAFVEGVTPFDIGFPANFIGTGEDIKMLMAHTANIDKQPLERPITLAAKP
ncbi:arylalcohol dehydrogenase [Coprinopsis sp. MPI-PUGE-AT-0042]|nr:arylalcohol dehydrogenase [Coprinopsis sp. MPI-PUGE-AT-0042]